ncbi:subclass B3 metallo-beta-lactamase [Cystobacter fuscus]|uniref:subclass B3 metallo-beta-lactamase n=1 Tax=Cystobacter fuscus TaxID=43 RepID=UPI002B2901E3|nr:subclass B3 metallo-beta-lactamase [Cystobacter fuscus]
MKPLHLAAASLALVLALPSSAQPAAPTPPAAHDWPSNWNTPTEPFRIIDNIYYVGTEGLGSYLFVTPEGHILLDGALPESAPLIEANIQKLGFKLSDIKYLLNSHAHFDHSGGLAQLKKDTGATLIASERDQSALEGGFYLGNEDEGATVPKVKVDRAIQDGYQLKLGGRTLTAHLTPGHSRGCTSWGFEAKDGGKTHPGLVFCSATIAANRLVERPQYEGIVGDYRSTFEKAARLKVDVFLAPHPEFFDLSGKRVKLAAGARPNPFIDPAGYQGLIARLKAAFEVGLKEQRDAAAAKAVKAKGK